VTRLLLAPLLLFGCLPPMPAGPPPPAGALAPEPEEPRLQPAADGYRTQAAPGGVVGGKVAERLAAAVAEALHARGAPAEADGALAATAAWFLRETAERRDHSSQECEQVARHYGFAGNLLTAVTAPLDGEKAALWRQSLAAVPVNVPVTRYGVRASPAGLGAVVFGTVEAELGPIPRHLQPGQSVRLRGEVSPRFQRATVYLTGVDGKVQERRMSGRRVETTLTFPSRGVYQAEVMGDGPTGPVVIVNVPIYVGVPEPALGADRPSLPAFAGNGEARMLALLNAARAKAGLAALAADPELEAVARGHSEDMARAHFIGHVSPTTGTPEDRIRRAGVPVTAGGENVSRAGSPEAAHQELMASPAHRANMLSPIFTHVGIASVPEGEQILTTLVFGRRPDPRAAPWTARQAVEAIAALRKARGLGAVHVDPGLRAAAEIGVKAFGGGGARGASAASSAALQSEFDRTGVSRPPVCVRLFEIGDPDQLAELPVLLEPRLRRMGVAVTTRTEGRTIMQVLLVLTEGIHC
jgi:uncharacterized protein YkwD